jgi:hypothetical protein
MSMLAIEIHILTTGNQGHVRLWHPAITPEGRPTVYVHCSRNKFVHRLTARQSDHFEEFIVVVDRRWSCRGVKTRRQCSFRALRRPRRLGNFSVQIPA